MWWIGLFIFMNPTNVDSSQVAAEYEILVTAKRIPMVSEYAAFSYKIMRTQLLPVSVPYWVDAYTWINYQVELATCHIRGISQKHNLILVNSVPIARELMLDFGILYPLWDKIELVRGSGTLYGSAAMGGVINFVSLPIRKTVVRVFLPTYTREGILRLALDVNLRCKGVNLQLRGIPENVSTGWRVPGLRFTTRYQWGTFEYDRLTRTRRPPDGVRTDTVNSISLKLTPPVAFNPQVTVFDNEFIEHYSSTWMYSCHREHTRGMRVEVRHHGTFNIVVGIDILHTVLNSTDVGDRERHETAGWSRGEYIVGNLILCPTVRLDYNRTSGRMIPTYNLGITYRGKLIVFASYGTAFRYPSFFDLYWPAQIWDGGGVEGNPKLTPESSSDWQIGLRHRWFELIMFDTRINDEIVWLPDTDNVWRPHNLGRVNSNGLELTLRYALGILHMEGNLTYTRAMYDGTRVPYYPRWRVNLNSYIRLRDYPIFSVTYVRETDRVDISGKGLPDVGWLDIESRIPVDPHAIDIAQVYIKLRKIMGKEVEWLPPLSERMDERIYVGLILTIR